MCYISLFYVFQASTSIIYFTDAYWPEFTFWHLLAGVFYYQRHHKKMSSVRKSLNQFNNFIDNESLPLDFEQSRQQKSSQTECEHNGARTGNFSQNAIEFLEKFDKRKHNKLLKLASLPNLPNLQFKALDQQLKEEIAEISAHA